MLDNDELGCLLNFCRYFGTASKAPGSVRVTRIAAQRYTRWGEVTQGLVSEHKSRLFVNYLLLSFLC